MPTQTTLPGLDDSYELTDNQCDQYAHKGHICLREVMRPDEVEPWRKVIAGAVERVRKEIRGGVYQTELKDRDTYARAFMQIENLWQLDNQVRGYVLARRFAGIAARLLGVPAVRIYHDQALFKEPGGGYTPWHQDQYYWPLDTTKTITMWMPLVDMGTEMGTLVFGNETQNDGPWASLAISDTSEAFYKAESRRRGITLETNELNAGDATFHNGWTIHKAPGNTTDRMRQVMTIIYYADGTRVSEFSHEKHPAESERWLGGRKPGELADGPLNPVVGPNQSV